MCLNCIFCSGASVASNKFLRDFRQRPHTQNLASFANVVLNIDRASSELQQAYREWLCVTDSQTLQDVPDSADASGSDRRKAKWFAYLAAKSRLVAANAERPAA